MKGSTMSYGVRIRTRKDFRIRSKNYQEVDCMDSCDSIGRSIICGGRHMNIMTQLVRCGH